VALLASPAVERRQSLGITRVLGFVNQNLPSHLPINRRQWLQIGSLAGLTGGMNIANAETENLPIPGFGKAKSVLLVVASGGQSQFETWDPKPEAPDQIRGEFSAIPTAVPGMMFCEHLPQIAKVSDRLSVVRSMSHEDLDHGSAFYLTMTGRYHFQKTSNPQASPLDYPFCGSILKKIRPTSRFVHTAINVNGPAQVPVIIGPGQFGGILGREFDPMVIGNVTESPVVVPGLNQQDGLPMVRLRKRQSLLNAIEGSRNFMARNQTLLDMNELYQQAYEMLEKPQTRYAFDLSAESNKLKNRYGRNRSGQACLLGRRLVEAGVPLVTVIFNHINRGQDLTPNETDTYGWDTHNDIFYSMKNHLLPRFDQAFSALIEDMDARGLLEETLVICLGEFGRAPKVALEPRFAGATPGRKHWSSVYSIVMAGAGVKRGAIIGASDARGAYPTTEKYGPWDVTATLFSALGINPHGYYADPTGRELQICEGKPMEAVYAG